MKREWKVLGLIIFAIVYLFAVTTFVIINGIEDLRSIILFALSLGLIAYASKMYKQLKNGEVSEDEMSTMIRDKAGARSFFMSLYFWFFMAYTYDVDSEVLIIGFAGMAILFAINYAVISNKGTKI